MRKLIIGCLVAALVAMAVSCQPNQNPLRERRALQVGSISFQVETVQTEADRELGLMYRTDLTDQQGMLFVFESDQQLAFWMKNTLIPLSIAYIDSSGRIRQILDMKPQSLASVLADVPVRYASEVAQGAFARRGVMVGDQVNITDFLTTSH